MHLNRSTLRTGVGITSLAVLCLAATVACSSSSNRTGSSNSGAPSGATSAGATLSATGGGSGQTIKIGAVSGFPPITFTQNGSSTIVGTDASAREALTAGSGLKFSVTTISSFQGLIPALLSGRIDAIMSGMSDTKAREQQVDFVDYFEDGSSIITKAADAQSLNTLDALCGKKVAVPQGTIGVTLVQAASAKCGSKGAITISQFPDDTQALLQVKSGRDDATVLDYAVGGYQIKQFNGALVLAGQPFSVQPGGIAVRKGDTALRDTLQSAVQKAIDDGSLLAAAQKWGLGASYVPKQATVNGAVS
jgi:polar amino acid transport system substrate-binding protein